MANQFLALSMFIMLLAFFIILNTKSNFEDIKSRPVLTSLSSTFSSNKETNDLTSSVQEDIVETLGQGDTLDKLEALFRSQIVGADVKKNRLGTTMHVRLRVREFEKEIAAIQQGNVRNSSFVKTLVSLLNSEDAVPYRMDILLNAPGNPANLYNQSPQNVMGEVSKASYYSDVLERAGVPKILVTTGLKTGESGYIDFFFRRYRPFNPLGEKEGGA